MLKIRCRCREMGTGRRGEKQQLLSLVSLGLGIVEAFILSLILLIVASNFQFPHILCIGYFMC